MPVRPATPPQALSGKVGKTQMNGNTRKTLDMVMAAGLLLLFVYFLITGLTYPPRPRELPLLVSGICAVLCLAQFILSIRRSYKSWDINWAKVGYCFGTMGLFMVLAWLFGMAMGSALFVAVLGWLLGSRNRKLLAAVSVGTLVMVYVLFVRVLAVTLPKGIITGF
jgi:hypothetical protein